MKNFFFFNYTKIETLKGAANSRDTGLHKKLETASAFKVRLNITD